MIKYTLYINNFIDKLDNKQPVSHTEAKETGNMVNSSFGIPLNSVFITKSDFLRYAHENIRILSKSQTKKRK